MKENIKVLKERLHKLNTKKNQKRLIIYLIAILIFTIDLISKTMILKKGNVLLNKEVIPNFFYIKYSTNTGGAFSILSNYTTILIILGIFALVIIDQACIKDKMNKLEITYTSFLIGGIFGNLVDRVFRGHVIDFLSFIIFGYNFPIFNVADIFITVGAILFIIDIIRGEKHDRKRN